MSDKEFKEIKQGFSDRLFELASSLPNNKNSFVATDDAANMLIEAVSKYKTKSGMANYIRRESEGWATYSDYIVDDLVELVEDIRNMPTSYFEAKPQRAVGFDEIEFVVVPNDTDVSLLKTLEDLGISYTGYTRGDSQDRVRALNSVDDVRFSTKRTVANGKKKSYNKNSYYNEFDSLAMQWRYQADTKVGDLNIVNGKGGFALLEATEGGYVELAKGAWKEMKELRAEYERAYEDATDTFYGNIESVRVEQRRNIRNKQSYENRGNDDRSGERVGEKRRQNESPRGDEYSRFGDKEKPLIPSTKRQSSVSEDASNYILDTKEYKDVMKLVDQRYRLTGKKKLDQKAIDRFAGRLLSKSQSQYSREQLTERLSALFD